jgi:hypothetical protein
VWFVLALLIVKFSVESFSCSRKEELPRHHSSGRKSLPISRRRNRLKARNLQALFPSSSELQKMRETMVREKRLLNYA